MTNFRTDYRGAIPRILIHPYNTFASGAYRQEGPAKALREQGLALTRVDPHEVSPANLQVMAPDVIVLPSVYTDDRLAMMARYAKNSPESFIIYDIEDAVWALPKHNPAYSTCPKDIKKRIAKAIGMAHRVTVTTETLADMVAKDFRIPRTKIKVVQNSISRTFLNACQSVEKTPNTGKMRVGWAGGASHSEDLKILTEVVKATADKYQWVFMGFVPEGVEHLVEFHQPVDLADYPRALAAMNLDVAVAPLVDDKFNSGKSDLRILEFAACGYAVLASHVPSFVGAPVDTTLNETDEWILNLERFEYADIRADTADHLYHWLLEERMQDSEDVLDTVINAWMPTGCKGVKYCSKDTTGLPSSVVRVPNGYLITRPGTVVPEIPLQGIYHKGVASVSAVSNDGTYPTYGKFLSLNDEAAQTLPAAAYTLDPTPIEIPRINSPYVFLSDNAIVAIGMPDFVRYGSVSAALIEWSVRTTEAGFKHFLKPTVFAVTSGEEQTQSLVTFAARQIVAWYPDKVLETIEKKTNELQDGLVTILSKLDCAAFRLIPTSKHRILHINGVQESPVRAQLIEDGHSLLAASTLGHLLTLDPRYVIYAEPIDLRREIDRLINIIDECGFNIILLDGLHEGSPDVLGTFGELARRGYNVQYIPDQLETVCPRINMMQPSGPCSIQDKAKQEGFDADRFCNLCVREHGSNFGIVNALAYRTTWRDFLEAVYKPTVNPADSDE